MASTIKSTSTSTTKKVAGKTIKTTTDEVSVVISSDSIALDKNKKKAETLIAELVRLRQATTDLENQKKEITEAIYELMGWELTKVGEKSRWVGVAKKGTIKGAVRITISERNRTDVDNKKLELDYPEVYASVAYDNPYSVIITK